MGDSAKGNRKLTAQRQSQLIVLLGFALVVYSHVVSKTAVGADIFMWFVGGAVGNAAAFMWGNSKEWNAKAGAPDAPKPV